MTDLETYRQRPEERERSEDLMRIVPKGRISVLDIGAREGHFSKLLAEYYPKVTALDLEEPAIDHPRVGTVAGDVTRLEFADNSFDCVFCSEVLEHLVELNRACAEILRVARDAIVIGVPFRQDTRVGRTTCQQCGRANPPWGHVNTFDEKRLRALFAGAELVSTTYVGTNRDATNALSAALMDLAGNPWGTYHQDEPCIHCGKALGRPRARYWSERVCSGVAARLNRLQSTVTKPHAEWIHVVFSKRQAESRWKE